MTKLVCCYAQEISILDYDSGTMKEDKQTGFLSGQIYFFLTKRFILHFLILTVPEKPRQNPGKTSAIIYYSL